MTKMTKTAYRDILKSARREVKTVELTVGENKTIYVEINPNIGFVNRLVMIQNIVEGLFVDDVFQPPVQDIVTYANILLTYTNLPIKENRTDKEGAMNLDVFDDVFNLVYNTNIMECVKDAIGESAYNSIFVDVQKCIDSTIKNIEKENSTINILLNAFNDLVDSVKENIDEDTLKKIGGALSDTVGGDSPVDLSSVINVIK